MTRGRLARTALLRAVGRRRLIVCAREHGRRCVAFGECLCVCNCDDATEYVRAAGRKGGRASGQWSRMAHARNAASEGLPAAGWSLLPVRKRVSPRPPLSFVNDASSSATKHRREKPVVRRTAAVSLVPTARADRRRTGTTFLARRVVSAPPPTDSTRHYGRRSGQPPVRER